MKPCVSVIIPIYNAADFLQEAVNSVLDHNCVGEILLIEDGSTDNSFELCLRLQKSDQRIKVLFHENHKNRGAAHSRNLGILNAYYPYLAFLDSDDIYYSNRFQESIEILNRESEIQGVFGKVLKKDLNNNSQKLFGVANNISSCELFGYILNGGYFHTNTITVRKSFFNVIGHFNQKFWPGEDVEMWIRMSFLKSIAPIQSDTPIAEYRIHGNNLSFSKNGIPKFVFWQSIFISFFLKKIGLKNRLIILKQIIKSVF